MNWAALMAVLVPLVGSQPLTVPTPRLYEDRNVVVTLRPAVDLDLNYIGLSLQIRAAKVN